MNRGVKLAGGLFYDDVTYRESTFTESDHSERLVEKMAIIWCLIAFSRCIAGKHKRFGSFRRLTARGLQKEPCAVSSS